MKSFVVAAYASQEKLVTSARSLTKKNIPIFDIFTPFPIHELEEILQIRRSRLPIVTFVAGCAGLVLALGFQVWVFTISWPIIVGGKPFNAVPAFIPVVFESTVLLAGLATVAAFFFRSGLYPGKTAVEFHPDSTDHRFAIALERSDASLDEEEVINLLQNGGAEEIRRVEVDL